MTEYLEEILAVPDVEILYDTEAHCETDRS